MRYLALVLACSSLLGACAGSAGHGRMMLTSGIVRFDTCETAECDYKIYARNAWDFDWDMDSPNDRFRVVKSVFGGRCDHMQVIEETTVEMGTYPLGRPARTYVMKVRCPAS